MWIFANQNRSTAWQYAWRNYFWNPFRWSWLRNGPWCNTNTISPSTTSPLPSPIRVTNVNKCCSYGKRISRTNGMCHGKNFSRLGRSQPKCPPPVISHFLCAFYLRNSFRGFLFAFFFSDFFSFYLRNSFRIFLRNSFQIFFSDFLCGFNFGFC